MAKKKSSKKSVKNVPTNENVLPQNILSIGERVEENKNIYISQPVYNEIHKFTQNKTTNESGGMLIGSVIEEFGKTNIIIKGFIEAKYCEATPTTLKFTHETWDFVHKEMDRKYPGQKIVGWIHTHPNFGIFLSEYDKFIQENFFKEEYQIAYVVDPIQNIEGFYFWINGKIERCKGFFKFDKTGAKIKGEVEADDAGSVTSESSLNLKSFIIAILVVSIVVLSVLNISQHNKIENLEQQQKLFIEAANQNFTNLDKRVTNLQTKVSALENELEQAENSLKELQESTDESLGEIDASSNEAANDGENVNGDPTAEVTNQGTNTNTGNTDQNADESGNSNIDGASDGNADDADSNQKDDNKVNNGDFDNGEPSDNTNGEDN